MKKIYSLFVSLLFMVHGHLLLGQCSADIQIMPNGIGGYTFLAINLKDTGAFTNYYWTVNTDSIPIDSNTLQASYTYHTNGAYSVCLQLTDTSTGCLFDTCKSFSVIDAEYHPLLDSVNIWSMILSFCFEIAPHNGSNGNPVSRSVCSNFYNYNNSAYFTGNDTFFNNLLYKQLFLNAFDYYGVQTPPCMAGFIREDSSKRKIYFWDINNNYETLLYDFSMKIGDTITINFTNSSYYSYWQNGVYQLDSVKLVSIAGNIRRAFFLNTDSSYQSSLIWVEGIGNLADPLYYDYFYGGCGYYYGCNGYDPVIELRPYGGSFVSCFTHQQSLYFDSCSYAQALQMAGPCFAIYDSCAYGLTCGAVKEVPILSSFDISPNPGNNKITLSMDVSESSNLDIILWDLQGRQVTGIYYLGAVPSGLQQKEIDISSLAGGFYLVECRSKAGSLYRKLVVQY